jgi:transposase-like protein
VIKRMHHPLEVMLVCLRWYAAYPLSQLYLPPGGPGVMP